MSRRIAFSLVSLVSLSLGSSGCELVNKFEGWTPPEGSAAGRGNVAGNAGSLGKLNNLASAGNVGSGTYAGGLGGAGGVGAIAPVSTLLGNASGAPATGNGSVEAIAGSPNAAVVSPTLGGAPNALGAAGAAGLIITQTFVGLGGAVTAGQGNVVGGVGANASAGRSDGVGASSGSGGTSGARNIGGSAATLMGGATTSGGAVSGGTTASGGTSALGGAISGGTTGTTSSCTNEGCACTGTATIPCNDCGTRACNQTTHQWGACTATQSPAATQCANSTTLQTCGSDGKWVSSTCTNADTTHCTVSCVTGASSSSCVVAAIDADTDGHKNKQCTAAPGDDCDDGNANIHPGATEVCDGVDNDCNGKADLKDGLLLSGTVQVQSDPRPYRVTWSPTNNKFAMVGWGSSVAGPVFGVLSAAGIASWNTTGLNLKRNEYTYIDQLLWIQSRSSFALLTSLSGRSTDVGTFIYDISDQGVASSAVTTFTKSFDGALAIRANGDALMSFGGFDDATTYVGRYAGANVASIVAVTGEDADAPRIATSGDLSAVVYQIRDTNTINWFRVNASLVAGTPTQLTSSGQRPEIANIGGNYAVAWLTTAGFDYQVRSSTDGSVVCGPSHVPFGDGVLDYNDDLVIAATQYGTLVFATDVGGTEARLFRMDSSCTVADSILAGSVADAAIEPNIAVGGGYVALTWANRSTAATGYTRVIGERLCN